MFALTYSQGNSLCAYDGDLHLTLTMLQQYFVKFENSQ